MDARAIGHFQEAQRLDQEAARFEADSKPAEALQQLRLAVLHYAEAERLAEEEAGAPAAWRAARATACDRCGDWLAWMERLPEAVGLYQEAADLYGLLADADAGRAARDCAQKALKGIMTLRARPQDRLYLLIAQHERRQRQLTLQAGTIVQQAECCAHIAAIFMRRDRPTEAIQRFQEALELYARAPKALKTLLAQGECHHRLAGLLANQLNDPLEAARQYSAAIAIYTAYEPAVYGRQQARELCVLALDDLKRYLPDEKKPHE